MEMSFENIPRVYLNGDVCSLFCIKHSTCVNSLMSQTSRYFVFLFRLSQTLDPNGKKISNETRKKCVKKVKLKLKTLLHVCVSNGKGKTETLFSDDVGCDDAAAAAINK